jgi:hypothetical protein
VAWCREDQDRLEDQHRMEEASEGEGEGEAVRN